MPVPYSITLSISDAKGDQSLVTIPVSSSETVVNVIDFAEAIIPLIQPLVTGALRAAEVSIPVAFTPWPAVASVADVQEKARFAFRTANGFLKHLSLPTFLESLFTPGSRDVDLADTNVAAFVTAMVDGLSVNATTVEPTDTRDEDITELEAASEAWGRARS